MSKVSERERMAKEYIEEGFSSASGLKGLIELLEDFDEENEVSTSAIDRMQRKLELLVFKAWSYKEVIGRDAPAEFLSEIEDINRRLLKLNEEYDQELFVSKKVGDITISPFKVYNGEMYYLTRNDRDEEGRPYWRPLKDEDFEEKGYYYIDAFPSDAAVAREFESSSISSVPDGRGGMYTINPLDVEAAAAAGAASSSDSSHKLVGEAPEDGCCHCCTVS